MGLIQDIINKAKYLDRVDFDDFDLKLKKNKKTITSYLNTIYKDMDIIEKYPKIQDLIQQIKQSRETNYMNLSFYLQADGIKDCFAQKEYPDYYKVESERFAIGYCELIYFAQCYALYYMYGTSTSREESSKTKVVSRLVCIYDTMRFAYLQYMLMGRGEYAEWKDVLKCDPDSKVLELAQKVFDNSCLIAKMLKAVQDDNSVDVNDVFNELCSGLVADCYNPFEE